MKQQFHLVNDAIKQNAINFIRELPVDARRPLILDIKEMTRTLEQNKKMWPLLKDLSDQVVWFGNLHGGQWDCGHFKTVGAYPQLRFEERNAHKQCKSCNAGAGKYTAKESTVAQQYEAGLVARYGQEYVDWLNGPHEMTNYRREDFIRIRDEYRAKLKALKQREAA
ncbi:recombination protein NinG [Klebsiella pneumoniae]|uniref:recombination protein NinG n=1 Tax=Klebsiella pneumoniae TaxID=573 RepID=UPI00265A7270|nr:recombination protein NinG [Klebsiella pneumoniae]